jgi:AcrR family transcriptional regulator
MQRRRLLSATVELAYEQGIHSITVATLCERAGLSRRTFYECFSDVQACVLATFSDSMERAARVVEEAVTAVAGDEEEASNGRGAGRGTRTWREQARAGLTALLGFFDSEPGIARLLVVEALGAGHDTLEARRRGIAQIIAFVDRGRSEAKANREPPPLTAEGTVGAVFSVIHARILEVATSPSAAVQPLVELVGPLMATIVQPYLGTAAARRELALPPPAPSTEARRLPTDPFKDLPIRLTYRTVLVLRSIAEKPGASSKRIALAAGITDPGQTSRLLTRLQRTGLIGDTGVGPAKGQARAWTLTERGRDILQATGQD